MPEQGIFEFDFVYLVCPPSPDLLISNEQFEKVLAGLKNM